MKFQSIRVLKSGVEGSKMQSNLMLHQWVWFKKEVGLLVEFILERIRILLVFLRTGETTFEKWSNQGKRIPAETLIAIRDSASKVVIVSNESGLLAFLVRSRFVRKVRGVPGRKTKLCRANENGPLRIGLWELAKW
jgi:hypothetical protein